MGDGADYYDEVGMDAYFLHLAGQCEPDCIYCAEETEDNETEDV